MEHTANGMKLGFGLMRLPKTADGAIDLALTSRMVDAFLAAGGTYFDTAYVYEGSEEAARRALVERHPRESFTLCTKLCAWLNAETAEGAKAQFRTSLERTGAGYFDFYLLHAVQEDNYAKYDAYGLWDFVREQKAKGLVRHWGFSFHASPERLDALLTEHPDVDFVQLQLNYADWESPDVASRACWEVARRHGKPIAVMEPVKGGLLARPPERVRRILSAADETASCASWALRYAASLDGVFTVLSGMSDMAQMEDNLATMRDFRPLSPAEEAVIRQAGEALADVDRVPCTACHYCTGGCPMEIPIPDIFEVENERRQFEQPERSARAYARAIRDKGRARDCVGCLQCENACPQHLPITELLKACADRWD